MDLIFVYIYSMILMVVFRFLSLGFGLVVVLDFFGFGLILICGLRIFFIILRFLNGYLRFYIIKLR